MTVVTDGTIVGYLLVLAEELETGDCNTIRSMEILSDLSTVAKS